MATKAGLQARSKATKDPPPGRYTSQDCALEVI